MFPDLTLPLWASFYDLLSSLTKLLAILGGATVGAFVLGYLVRVFLTMLTGRQLPRWGHKIVQLGGAILFGTLTALWVYGGGGDGVGGPGGNAMGSGSDEAIVHKDVKDPKPVDKKPTESDHIAIEILGPHVTGDDSRLFHQVGEDRRTFYTEAEIKEKVRKRKEAKPPLKTVIVILYADSPDEMAGPPRLLKAWLRADQNLQVTISKRDENAPYRTGAEKNPPNGD